MIDFPAFGQNLGSLFLQVLVFAIQGWIVFRVLKTLSIVCRSVRDHLLRRPLDLRPYLDKWTVVTGCTDGIGLAYTEELARTRGIRKFLLIGRNPKKLGHVAQLLREQFGCEVRTHVFDFESTQYDGLASEIAALGEIGILINCAGIAPERVASFPEQPEGLSSKILQVNLMSTVRLIEMVLPGMIERRDGILVNVGSICGWRPYPYMSSYPASKAGLSFFASSLHEELADKGIRVQCLVPLLVATKMASYEAEEANNVFVVEPRAYARQAVRLIGNTFLSTGCVQHDIQIAAGQMLGFWLFKQIFVPLGMLRIHKKRMDRYHEKQRQNQKLLVNGKASAVNGSIANGHGMNGGTLTTPLTTTTSE